MTALCGLKSGYCNQILLLGEMKANDMEAASVTALKMEPVYFGIGSNSAIPELLHYQGQILAWSGCELA